MKTFPRFELSLDSSFRMIIVIVQSCLRKISPRKENYVIVMSTFENLEMITKLCSFHGEPKIIYKNINHLSELRIVFI